jgi:S1-C subfamily serine protease
MLGSKLLGAMWFLCGLLIGASLVTAPRQPQVKLASEAGPRDAIESVSGHDARGASDHAPDDGRAAPEPSGAPAEPPAQRKEAAQRGEHKRKGELARRAVGFTVFVRGGNVYGAGMLLDRAGHVLTCHHVIEGLDRISVSFSDGETFTATVLDSDAELDLALLRIAPVRASKFVPASVTSVDLGDDVFAIGAPRKMAFSLSRGMASFIGRPFGSVYYLQTDLAMNAGSSGGPVMNEDGDVIAISSFVLRNSEGLAFALPIDYAYRRFRKWLPTPKALEGTGEDAFEGWLSQLDRARSATATAY